MDEIKNSKNEFPSFNNKGKEIPNWQKEIVLERLEQIKKNPNLLLPIEDFFD